MVIEIYLSFSAKQIKEKNHHEKMVHYSEVIYFIFIAPKDSCSDTTIQKSYNGEQDATEKKAGIVVGKAS